MEIKKEFNRCDNCGSMWEKESPTSNNSDYEKCHALACKIVNEYDFDTSEELLAGFIQRHFA
jgi:hypothetical protein